MFEWWWWWSKSWHFDWRNSHTHTQRAVTHKRNGAATGLLNADRLLHDCRQTILLSAVFERDCYYYYSCIISLVTVACICLPNGLRGACVFHFSSLSADSIWWWWWWWKRSTTKSIDTHRHTQIILFRFYWIVFVMLQTKRVGVGKGYVCLSSWVAKKICHWPTDKINCLSFRLGWNYFQNK